MVIAADRAVTIETPEGTEALTEFVLFQDKVYESRAARWPAMVPMILPTLTGEGPSASGRDLRPFVARQDGEIVARVLAVVDHHYLGRWNDGVGHLPMFEALPGTRIAVKSLIDAACEWLHGQGMTAGRAGFGGVFEFPFAVDSYETLPPPFVRQNPAYYHALLKDAGFESEQGWVDYKIEVTPELVARYTDAVEAAKLRGFDIVPLGEVAEAERVATFVRTFNAAFVNHWGFAPMQEGEAAELFETVGPLGLYDASVVAYREGKPVGVLFIVPDISVMAATNADRELRPDERLNVLGIGVLEEARGQGVNMAMSGYAYLRLIGRGQTHLSYTLVLDDNWPSRRTAEKLGATVCANYMVYRRNFGRRAG
jgi:GNAT superfamily N-acetyltransferase